MDILVSILNKADQSSRQVRCPLVEPVIVGRGSECGVSIEGPAISREHLVLEKGVGNAVLVGDLSANGSWINGDRIPKSRRVPVSDSDTVEVPGFELRIRVAESASAPALPEAPASKAVTVQRQAGPLTPVFALLSSFTGMEKTTAVAAIISLALILGYALS